MTNDDRAFFVDLLDQHSLRLKTELKQELKTELSAEISEQFERRVAVISENFDLKIGLIADGHMTLHDAIKELARKNEERFDMVDFKIDTVAADLKATDKRLTQKIDGVATDLKAHRNDTEAHGGIYQVKET